MNQEPQKNQFFTKLWAQVKNIVHKAKRLIKKCSTAITAFFKRLKKQDYFLIGFYILLLLSVINLSIMTIHLMDPNYKYPILKTSYIDAIYPDQDLTNTMYTDIVKITEFDEQDIQVGDSVVINSDFNINENWVEEIVSIDYDSKQIELTYDNLSTITVSYDKVIGVYDSNANIFGTIYFTSKFYRGYILLMISHAFVLTAYFFAWIDRRE
jgi:hypothetical protein